MPARQNNSLERDDDMKNLKKIACVFPGQGSQKQGMLAEWADNVIIRDTLTEASDALGYDVWNLIENNPDDRLNQTEWTQPAMMVSDVAIYRVFRQALNDASLHDDFGVMAGHSLGEYAALVCAGAISLKDAVILVKNRGRLMQTIIPEGSGAMAAIVGLNDEQVIDLCKRIEQSMKEHKGEHIVLEAANFNSVGQVVIAGDTEAVNNAVAMALEEGARLAKVIPVSVPCHCKLLYPVAEASIEYLNQITIVSPKIPVIHNVHADILIDSTEIKTILRQQLYQPVQWVATIRKMAADGITTVIECGPGSVLTGLNKRIDRSLQCYSIDNPESLDKTLLKMREE